MVNDALQSKYKLWPLVKDAGIFYNDFDYVVIIRNNIVDIRYVDYHMIKLLVAYADIRVKTFLDQMNVRRVLLHILKYPRICRIDLADPQSLNILDSVLLRAIM